MMTRNLPAGKQKNCWINCASKGMFTFTGRR